MQVDDNRIFMDYYSLRQTDHIPIHRFIDDKRLKVSVKKFYNLYRRWLLDNGMEYTYWNSTEYLDWYCKYFKVDDNTKERCMGILKDINRVKEEFNPLTIATSVFIIGSGKPKNEIVEISGLTPTPIQKCIKWIDDNKLYSKRENNIKINMINVK
jgi:hypothetical protein